jgi:hypothetical protein
MEDIMNIALGLLILLAAGLIIYGCYYLLSRLLFFFLRFSLRRELAAGKLKNNTVRYISKLLIAAVMVWGALMTFPHMGCNASRDNPYGDLKLEGLQGKISYYIPDTFYVGKKNERVSIRIARASLDDKVFLKGMPSHTDSAAAKAATDTIPLSSVMEVNLIETTPEKKLTIQRINNNSRQVIDPSGYSEWLFEVTANDYGEVYLTVSVSVALPGDRSYAAQDIRIYDKSVKAYASGFQKAKLFLSDHYLLAGSASLMLLLFLYRVLPEWAGKLRIVKIFLASSEELKEDRRAIEIFISRENKKWKDKGLFFELVIWEDFLNAVSQTSLQDEYNAAIKTCDMCVVLFYTKVGRYTHIEFETAYRHFKEKGKPLIFTFFKQPATTVIIQADITAFQEQLAKIGHFYTKYANTEDLLLQLDDQVEKLYNRKRGALG